MIFKETIKYTNLGYFQLPSKLLIFLILVDKVLYSTKKLWIPISTKIMYYLVSLLIIWQVVIDVLANQD